MDPVAADTGAAIRQSRRKLPRVAVGIVALLVVGGVGASWWFFDIRRTTNPPADRGDISQSAGAAAGLSGWRETPGYVGSQACRNCHPEEYRTYLETPHSRAMAAVFPEREPPDVVFDHPLSGRRYRVTRRDGRLFHEESLVLEGGEELQLASHPLIARFGSGHFGFGYLCETDGFLLESPVSWFTGREAWGMSPGYDIPRHQSFQRVIPKNCLLCHAGNVETGTTSDLRLRIVEESIGCERCHGPGEAHVAAHRRAGDGGAEHGGTAGDHPMVNPAALSRKLSEAVCQQCHLLGDIQVPGRGVKPSDYRPGLALEPFRLEFRVRKPRGGIVVVGHFEQLAQSACYRASEILTCVTCHNPHATIPPAERPAHYRSVCMTCHADRGCKLPLQTREARSDNDCARCHMPSAATELPHVALTNHRIGIDPQPGSAPAAGGSEPLYSISDMSALSDGDRSRALVLAQLHLFIRMGPATLQLPSGQEIVRRISELLRALPPASVDAAVEVAGAEFLLMCGNLRGAVQAAERALQRDAIRTDEEVRALVVLAYAAFSQNQFEVALPRYRRLAQLRLDAEDWHHLGMCENNCGNPEAAIRALETASRIDPADLGYYEALALIHQARHDRDATRLLHDTITKIKRWKSQFDLLRQ